MLKLEQKGSYWPADVATSGFLLPPLKSLGPSPMEYQNPPEPGFNTSIPRTLCPIPFCACFGLRECRFVPGQCIRSETGSAYSELLQQMPKTRNLTHDVDNVEPVCWYVSCIHSLHLLLTCNALILNCNSCMLNYIFYTWQMN